MTQNRFSVENKQKSRWRACLMGCLQPYGEAESRKFLARSRMPISHCVKNRGLANQYSPRPEPPPEQWLACPLCFLEKLVPRPG